MLPQWCRPVRSSRARAGGRTPLKCCIRVGREPPTSFHPESVLASTPPSHVRVHRSTVARVSSQWSMWDFIRDQAGGNPGLLTCLSFIPSCSDHRRWGSPSSKVRALPSQGECVWETNSCKEFGVDCTHGPNQSYHPPPPPPAAPNPTSNSPGTDTMFPFALSPGALPAQKMLPFVTQERLSHCPSILTALASIQNHEWPPTG